MSNSSSLVGLCSGIDQYKTDVKDCFVAGHGCSWVEQLGETQFILTVFDWENWVLIVLSFFLLLLGPYLFQLSFRFTEANFKIAEQLIKLDNKAVSVTLTGFMLGLGFILTSAINDTGSGVSAFGKWGGYAEQGTTDGVAARATNIGHAALAIVIGVVLMIVGQYFNRFVITSRVNLSQGIVDGNLAAALIESSHLICTSLTIGGSMGFGIMNVGSSIAAVAINFLAGQFILLCYSKLFQIITRSFDIWVEVEAKNTAAALSYAMHNVAIANLVYASVSRSFELPTLAAWFGMGAVLLLVLRWFADIALLTGENLDKEIKEDKNWGAAMVTGAAQIGITIMLSTYIADPCLACNDAHKNKSLADQLTEHKYLQSIFNWDRLFALAVILFVMMLAKFVYTIPYMQRKHAFIKIHGISGYIAAETVESVPLDNVPSTAGGSAPSTVIPAREITAEDSKVAKGFSGRFQEIASFNLSQELVRKDNKAMAISFSGYILGLSLVLAGCLEPLGNGYDINNPSSSIESGDATGQLLEIIAFTVIGLVLLVLSHYISDKFILYKYATLNKLRDGNISTGCLEAGVYVASGLVVGASLSGDTMEHAWEDYVSALFCYTLCQIFLIGFALVFERMTTYVQMDEMRNDNAAAGINFAVHVIAVGLLVAKIVGTTNSILAVIVWSFLGIVLLFLGRKVVDHAVMPGEALDSEISNDKNWGAALVSGGVAISIVDILNTAVQFCPYEHGLRI